MGDADGSTPTDHSSHLGLRVGAIFILLSTSAIGSLAPHFLNRFEGFAQSQWFRIAKSYAAGVVLATGFIHMMPDAQDSLKAGFGEGVDFPFAALFALSAVLLTLTIEQLAGEYFQSLHSNMNATATDATSNNGHGSHAHSHGHGSSNSHHGHGNPVIAATDVFHRMHTHHLETHPQPLVDEDGQEMQTYIKEGGKDGYLPVVPDTPMTPASPCYDGMNDSSNEHDESNNNNNNKNNIHSISLGAPYLVVDGERNDEHQHQIEQEYTLNIPPHTPVENLHHRHGGTNHNHQHQEEPVPLPSIPPPPPLSATTTTPTTPAASSSHGHSHGHMDLLSNMDINRHARSFVIAHVLEMGIAFHSVIIGITLGVTTKITRLQALLAALVFHQFFEGFALGSSVLEANMQSKVYPIVMSIIFAITTPTGVAIGIGISSTYDENSTTALLTQGTFDSISAGILIYMALVDLVSEEFRDLMTIEHKAKYLRLKMLLALTLGSGCMAVLAVWA